MTPADQIKRAFSTATRLLSAWFQAFDAGRFDERSGFDERIERDMKAGTFDGLADEALAEHRAARTREL